MARELEFEYRRQGHEQKGKNNILAASYFLQAAQVAREPESRTNCRELAAKLFEVGAAELLGQDSVKSIFYYEAAADLYKTLRLARDEERARSSASKARAGQKPEKPPFEF